MPTRWTNSFYISNESWTWGGGIRCPILVLHRFRPLVQAAVGRAIRRVVVVAVFLNHSIIYLAIYGGRRVNHGTHVQVLREPALSANLNGGVSFTSLSYRLSTSGTNWSGEQ